MTKKEKDDFKISHDPTSWTIVDRLNILIGEESVSSFSRRAGISDSLLRKYLNGSQPGAENLASIAEACGCTIDWIVTGLQPMFRSGNIAFELDPASNPSEIIGLIKTYLAANPDQQEAIRLLGKAIERPGAKAWFDVGNAITKVANKLPTKSE